MFELFDGREVTRATALWFLTSPRRLWLALCALVALVLLVVGGE